MLILADARHLPLRDGSVQCVVTSPPYFGLRDYGTATWDGGDAQCDHVQRQARNDADFNARTQEQYGKYSPTMTIPDSVRFRQLCGKCGAKRVDRQIGLESSPDAYVATLVAVFREVSRVLKDDGVCWLNLGDSYASGGIGRRDTSGEYAERRAAQFGSGTGPGNGPREYSQRDRPEGTKPKDLLGIPWRVAFALQADGWYLRSDIIWHKPNPMPESVTDRPTKSHEYLFLLSKAERYFYDIDAIREPHQHQDAWRNTGDWAKSIRDAGRQTDRPFASAHSRPSDYVGHINGRNKRTVWTVATMPYIGAHFATMPEALVEPCVLAGSRFGDLVFDPFLGSGTVGAVAERLGRKWVGTDLNPKYHELAKQRTAQRGLDFAVNE